MPSVHHPSAQRAPKFWLFVAVALGSFFLGLGCSVGSLIVQRPTPTATPFKTPKPTYTFTPYWTPTHTPTPTNTPTLTPTPTETSTPTPTATSAEAETEAAPPPEAAAPPPAPEEPTATPTPEEPTATPTPAFPFQVVYYKHDTGSPGETRLTGWIRLDYGPGEFKTLAGFQMKVTAPDGNVYLSDISGPGSADSTVGGAGDNHKMNTKLEIQPYTPGTYKVYLVEGGNQVSPEVELSFGADPRQYIHLDFFRAE